MFLEAHLESVHLGILLMHLPPQLSCGASHSGWSTTTTRRGNGHGCGALLSIYGGWTWESWMPNDRKALKLPRPSTLMGKEKLDMQVRKTCKALSVLDELTIIFILFEVGPLQPASQQVTCAFRVGTPKGFPGHLLTSRNKQVYFQHAPTRVIDASHQAEGIHACFLWSGSSFAGSILCWETQVETGPGVLVTQFRDTPTRINKPKFKSPWSWWKGHPSRHDERQAALTVETIVLKQ